MYRAATQGSKGYAVILDGASLCYILDESPGYSRRSFRSTFRFVDVTGKRIGDPGILARLNALRIPPAWTEIWICPAANGHLQATGRDQRGRKQYIYHADWIAQRSALKYERILEFAGRLPRIRRRVTRDLSKRGLSKEKVLATVLRLMERTLIRIGNERYVQQNESYGLTTLCDEHVRIRGGCVELRFRGKSGKWHECRMHDDRLARIVRLCQELPGQQLFQYINDHGEVHDVTSGDVNEYLRSMTGRDFSAKDFRTWAASSLALNLLCQEVEAPSLSAAKRAVVKVIDCVAKRLNNTRSICRKSYIHPGILEAYMEKSLLAHYQRATRRFKRTSRGLSKEEHLAREVLRALAKRTSAGR